VGTVTALGRGPNLPIRLSKSWVKNSSPAVGAVCMEEEHIILLPHMDCPSRLGQLGMTRLITVLHFLKFSSGGLLILVPMFYGNLIPIQHHYNNCTTPLHMGVDPTH
jgi:hypothetical protein